MATSLSLQAPPLTEERPELVGERKRPEPRWTGPHRVTATTSTAVCLAGKGSTWFHLAQCAKVPETPEETEEKGTAMSDTPPNDGSST